MTLDSIRNSCDVSFTFCFFVAHCTLWMFIKVNDERRWSSAAKVHFLFALVLGWSDLISCNVQFSAWEPPLRSALTETRVWECEEILDRSLGNTRYKLNFWLIQLDLFATGRVDSDGVLIYWGNVAVTLFQSRLKAHTLQCTVGLLEVISISSHWGFSEVLTFLTIVRWRSGGHQLDLHLAINPESQLPAWGECTMLIKSILDVTFPDFKSIL